MEPKYMKKPLTINQKSVPERGRKKGCQNDGKRSQKGAQMEDQNDHKEPKGSQRAAQKAKKAGKKEGGKKDAQKRSFGGNTGQSGGTRGTPEKAFIGKAFMRILQGL